MLFPGQIYIARGAWYFEIFDTSFCHVQVKTKKSLTIWALGPGTVSYNKSSPGYGITFINRLDEALR